MNYSPIINANAPYFFLGKLDHVTHDLGLHDFCHIKNTELKEIVLLEIGSQYQTQEDFDNALHNLLLHFADREHIISYINQHYYNKSFAHILEEELREKFNGSGLSINSWIRGHQFYLEHSCLMFKQVVSLPQNLQYSNGKIIEKTENPYPIIFSLTSKIVVESSSINHSIERLTIQVEPTVYEYAVKFFALPKMTAFLDYIEPQSTKEAIKYFIDPKTISFKHNTHYHHKP